jgi:hypothetical protein
MVVVGKSGCTKSQKHEHVSYRVRRKVRNEKNNSQLYAWQLTIAYNLQFPKLLISSGHSSNYSSLNLLFFACISCRDRFNLNSFIEIILILALG